MTNEEVLGLGVSVGMLSVIAIIVAIISIVAMWKIFTKAGKPGWHSIIPILNIYDFFDICWKGMYGIIYIILAFLIGFAESALGYNHSNMAGGTFQTANPNPVWLAILCIACIASIVIAIMATYKLSKAFGHGVGFTLGLIFLSPIFMLILAFEDNEYIGKEQISTTQG